MNEHADEADRQWAALCQLTRSPPGRRRHGRRLALRTRRHLSDTFGMYFGELGFETGTTREAQVTARSEDTAEGDNADEYTKEACWWSPSSLLTSGASAITAFTLAVAGMLGFVGYPVAEALAGLPDGPDVIQERATVGAIVAIVALALFFGTFPLSHRVLVDDRDTVPAWPRHLAGSAVVLAAIGTVFSTITILGSLVGDAP